MTTNAANPAVHSIHHANFPVSDPAKTEEWYGKVFGMKRLDVGRVSPGTRTMLLVAPDERFHLHFRPADKSQVLPGAVHFAIEVEDWDGFLAHLDAIGESYNNRGSDGKGRPSDNSKTTSLKDPDGYIVEIVHHPGRAW
jgi:lactoylglutathione lyase